MVIIEPVVKSWDARGFVTWPVSSDLDSEFLVLSGELAAADVGTVWPSSPSATTVAWLAVNPSCCCGREGWREWDQVAPGQSPWLGHTPTPWTEHLGDKIRVWPDGGDEAFPPAGTSPIEILADDLSGLIASAHKQFSDSGRSGPGCRSP